jgi:hypothetical protein
MKPNRHHQNMIALLLACRLCRCLLYRLAAMGNPLLNVDYRHRVAAYGPAPARMRRNKVTGSARAIARNAGTC